MAGIPVSGPGALSKRTDKQPMRDLPNADYGEQAQYQAQQQGAPLAATPEVNFDSLVGSAASRVIPMGADSQHPEVPTTDGVDVGDGRGSEAMNMSSLDDANRARIQSYMPTLEYLANRPGSSTMARNIIRKLKAEL